jgi:predicted nucleic acid-binding protein
MLERTPKNTNTTVPTIMDSGSFFQVDSKVRIAIDGKNENQIASQIRTEIAKDIETNKIKEIVLTKTTENVTQKVTAEELLEIFTIPVPELMTRSISPDWMLGVYSGIGGQKHVFIITTNNFFQNTFAGIIQWEKTMPQDLKLYTTNQNDSNFTLKGQYKDKIIKNKDVREYVLENGHINYLYSFVSNDKLVVTNSEEALDEIIIRLEKNAFVR